jgi:cell division protein FtsB
MNLRERIAELSLRNKIFITLLVLVGVIAIGSEVITMIRLRFEIAELRDRIEYYEQRYREDSILVQKLQSPEYLERYAREHYHMHADNEDIYIIRK